MVVAVVTPFSENLPSKGRLFFKARINARANNHVLKFKYIYSNVVLKDDVIRNSTYFSNRITNYYVNAEQSLLT